MANDDIVVGLKVKLDDQSMQEEVRRAEDRLHDKAQRRRDQSSSSTAGGRGRTARTQPGTSQPVEDDDSSAVSSALALAAGGAGGGRIGRAVAGAAGAAGGGGGAMLAAVGGPAGLVALGAGLILLVRKGVDYLKDTYRSIVSIGETLSNFSPYIAASRIEYQVRTMRTLIQMGSSLRDLYEGVYGLRAAVQETLWTVVRPPLEGLSVMVGGVLRTLEGYLNVFNTMMRTMGMDQAMWSTIFQVASEIGPGFLRPLFQALAVATQKPLYEQGAGHDILLKSLSEAAGGVPADKPVAEDQTGSQLAPGSKADKGVTRAPVPISGPQGNIRAEVEFNINQQLMHEEAVQRAIEQIRERLVFGLNAVRDEQQMMVNQLLNRTIVDMV